MYTSLGFGTNEVEIAEDTSTGFLRSPYYKNTEYIGIETFSTISSSS